MARYLAETSFEPNEALPIDEAQIEVQDWAGVDIESELTDTPGGRGIHQQIRQQLEAGDADVILFDHGTGEIADYITVANRQDKVVVTLYHCKASGGLLAGARLDDVYEVCCQAQKSVALANLGRFEKRIRQRRNRSVFVRGTSELLADILNRAKDMRHRFEVVVVQPGISKAQLSAAMAENLGATNSHLVGAGLVPLRVFASG